jgi:DNA adenine methylase
MADQRGALSMSPITPILRWAGSKRKVLPLLAAYWKPSFRRYIEPFVGSAALYFRLQPERAILADINEGLIEAYEVIREQPDALYREVMRLPRTEAQYYSIRAQVAYRLSRFKRAVRFVYLNRLCFNGIFRTNTRGQFNVPYAHSRSGRIPAIDQFRRSAMLLVHATLKSGDFGAILSSARRDDFVYLDPPYAVQSRRIFREYDKRAFTERDLNRLSDHLNTLDRKGASFVLSYADCKEARSLFSHWHLKRIHVRRNVAGFVGARRMAVELLATNIDPES